MQHQLFRTMLLYSFFYPISFLREKVQSFQHQVSGATKCLPGSKVRSFLMNQVLRLEWERVLGWRRRRFPGVGLGGGGTGPSTPASRPRGIRERCRWPWLFWDFEENNNFRPSCPSFSRLLGIRKGKWIFVKT